MSKPSARTSWSAEKPSLAVLDSCVPPREIVGSACRGDSKKKEMYLRKVCQKSVIALADKLSVKAEGRPVEISNGVMICAVAGLCRSKG